MQVGVFLNEGRAFTRVALIDAGVSRESPCRSFVLSRPAERRLTAVCGNEVSVMRGWMRLEGAADWQALPPPGSKQCIDDSVGRAAMA